MNRTLPFYIERKTWRFKNLIETEKFLVFCPDRKSCQKLLAIALTKKGCGGLPFLDVKGNNFI